MKKYILCLLLMFAFISCKKNDVNEYVDGVLSKSYTVDDDNEIDGVYKEFYKNGNVKTIHNFRNGILVDSSVSYYENSEISNIRFHNKKGDTVFCKTFKNSILESSGNIVEGGKIGYWDYYNEKGKVIKKEEWINLCGKQYLNQIFEYNGDVLTSDKGSFYKVILEKKKYVVGEKINIKIVYGPLLNENSKIEIYETTKLTSDFCNIEDQKLDNWGFNGKEATLKYMFSTPGNKNIRGYVEESFKPEGKEYLFRQLYFDISLVVE